MVKCLTSCQVDYTPIYLMYEWKAEKKRVTKANSDNVMQQETKLYHPICLDLFWDRTEAISGEMHVLFRSHRQSHLIS